MARAAKSALSKPKTSEVYALSTDERIRIIASLIVDQIMAEQTIGSQD